MNEHHIRKNKIEDYQLIIFDLDGTLYFQKPFRKKMLLFLMKHVLKHPGCVKDMFLIKRYREVREKWEELAPSVQGTDEMSLDDRQYAYVAAEKKVSPERVKKAVTFFMLEAPLSLLPEFADRELADTIVTLQEKGIQLAVYSDYPVKDKLASLGIEIENHFTAADEGIACMKPDPKGLAYVLKVMQCQPKNALMVGDRMEKDGQAAVANNVDYVILSGKKEERCGYLSHIFGI